MAAVLATPVSAVPTTRAGSRLWTGGALFVAAGAVLVVAGRQLGRVDVSALMSALDWTWAAVGLVLAASSFVAAGWSLSGFALVPIDTRTATAAQLAGAALKMVSPGSVGTVALNARLLQRAGSGTTASLGTVAASELVQVATSIALLAGIALLPQQQSAFELHLPAQTWLVGAAVLLVLGGVVVVMVRHRRRALADFVRGVRLPLVASVSSPRRAAAGVGGSVAITLALAGTLVASVHAVHGDIGLVDALLVQFAGALLGSAAPTPGGVGGVEAVMSGALVAVGLPLDVAVTAVLLQRLLTLWIPVPIGLAALGWLRSRAAV